MGVFHASVSYEKWAKKENKRRWKEEEWKAVKGRDRKFSKDRKQRVHGGGGNRGRKFVVTLSRRGFSHVSKLELPLLGI